MNISKNLTLNLGLVVCTVITGCDGYTLTENQASEIRSILVDLKVAEKRQSNTASEEIMTVQALTTEDLQSEPTIFAGQLNWEPAGYYDDGSIMNMDEISHYQIVFGTSEDNLSETVEFDMTGILTYNFTATPGNTWFIGVKTVSIYDGVSDVSTLTQFNI